MKRIITGTLVLGLAGLALAHVASASVSPAVSAQDALVAAGEAYANALLRGDGSAVASYLSDFCADAEVGDAVYAASLISRKAQGASLDVTSVVVDGDRGSVSGVFWSSGAPAGVRKAFSPASAASYPWRWIDGKWYFQGGCGVAPSASASPVRTAASIF